MLKLTGKNVIITGASRGLGAHIAWAMWRLGASLLLVARTEEALLELKAQLMAEATAEQDAFIVVANLEKTEAASIIVEQAHLIWDKVDVLVNNAAILGPIGQVWKNDWAAWQATIRVNLFAPIELCRASIPWMITHKQGKIINLSGGGATGPRPNFSAYATSKAGLVRFSETLASEVRDMNIQVNCVAPGAMNTEMLRTVLQAGPEKAGPTEFTQAKQIKEDGTLPERAAELCTFLASPASDGITGKLISAVWDPWETLAEYVGPLADSDIYTLRRIVPEDRGLNWKQL